MANILITSLSDTRFKLRHSRRAYRYEESAYIFAAALSTAQTAANIRQSAALEADTAQHVLQYFIADTAQHVSQSFIADSLVVDPVVDPGVVLQTLQWLAFSFSFFF